MDLNADVPNWDCLVRKEFLYNLERGHGEFAEVTVFGLASLLGRAIGFHVLVHETGAVIWRLPIHALCHTPDAPIYPLHFLELWDCFSYQVAVTEFSHLEGRQCMALFPDRTKHLGSYLFTVDWYGSAYAENAGDGGHKCAHLIELENGCYCALPNNRLLWSDAALIPKPYARRPDYITNTHIWKAEQGTKWVTEDTNRMFYEVECPATVPGPERAPVPVAGAPAAGFPQNGEPLQDPATHRATGQDH